MTSNGCNGARSLDSTASFHPKGSIVISVIVLLSVVSVAAIAGSIVVTARDGYRRQPRETFARTV